MVFVAFLAAVLGHEDLDVVFGAVFGVAAAFVVVRGVAGERGMVARAMIACFAGLAFAKLGAHVCDEVCAGDFGFGVGGAVADFESAGGFVLDHHDPGMRCVALFAEYVVDGAGVCS